MPAGVTGGTSPFFLRQLDLLPLFPGRGSRRAAGRCAAGMEDRPVEKVYVHYNHTDPCSHLRWTAKECYQYMYQQPWQRVSDFYSQVVLGNTSLCSLFPGANTAATATVAASDESGDLDVPKTSIGSDHGGKEIKINNSVIPATGKERAGRWARTTFKIVLSYHGGSFDGWQKQPGLNTVQGAVEKALGRFVDERKAQKLKDRSLPVEGCAVVAGRTDKGVTALQQVCSFYTWRKEVKARDIEDAINNAVPGKLRTLCAFEISRIFHPNFSATWRHYFYIFPLDAGSKQLAECERDDFTGADEMVGKQTNLCTNLNQGNGRCHRPSNKDEYEEVMLDAALKNKCFSVSKVNQLLHQLEGKSLSYQVFARDTKASRSTGPPTECYVFHARATEARLPCDDQGCGEELRVMCVELVANRFLRRMVRVLVATSIREAIAGAGDDALLKLTDATCRRATAPPAPPDGLCLVDVGYEQFRRERCFIH